MICTSCHAEFDTLPVASIAVMVAGDEVIHAYHRCGVCGSWSIEHFHDHFMTPDVDIWTTGPYPDEVGERCVALVRACPRPQSKLCDCESHELLYHGTPR